MLEKKLRQPSPGQPKPALTRLKELSAGERGKVMEILRAHTYEAARPLVEAMFGFGCSTTVLLRFFSWQAEQNKRLASEDTMRQVKRFIHEHRTDWPEERVREAAGTFFIMQAMKNKDAEEFVRVARVGIQDHQKENDQRRLELLTEKLKGFSSKFEV